MVEQLGFLLKRLSFLATMVGRTPAIVLANLHMIFNGRADCRIQMKRSLPLG